MVTTSNGSTLLTWLVMAGVQTIGAINTSMIHARVLASGSGISTCPAELHACQSDASCSARAKTIQEAVQGCFADPSAYCDDVGEALCCTTASGDGCQNNSVLEAYLGCLIEDSCPVDLSTCTSGKLVAGIDSTATDVTDATSDSTTTAFSSSSCPSEAETCKLDAACAACAQVFEGADAACFDGVTSTSGNCDEIGEALCCTIADGDGCQNKPALDAWFGCFYQGICLVDLSTCTGRDPGAGTDSTATDVTGATSDSTTTTFVSSSCPSEAETCKLDETCAACAQVFEGADAACFDGVTSTSGNCNEIGEALCCAIAAGDGCQNNPALDAWFGCFYEGICPVDLSTCTSTSAPTSTADRGISDSNSTTTADEDDDAEGADAVNTDVSSASLSAAVTTTTRAALLLATVVVFN